MKRLLLLGLFLILLSSFAFAGYSGCDPIVPDCTSSCGDLYFFPTNAWTDSFDYCYDSPTTATVWSDSYCDFPFGEVGLFGDGDCAWYMDGGTEVYCPEYNRLGYAASESDCVCYDGFSFDYCTNFGIFASGSLDFSNDFFAAAAGLPTLSPGTISTCGIIDTSGTYTLDQDIYGVPGTCFNITSSGVTLNGGGYTIDGSSTGEVYGVVAEDVSNIVVENFNGIGNFGDNFNEASGIFFQRVTSSSINNIVNPSSVINGVYGLHLKRSEFINVENVAIDGDSTGIYVDTFTNHTNLTNIETGLIHLYTVDGIILDRVDTDNIWLEQGTNNKMLNTNITGSGDRLEITEFAGITLDLAYYTGTSNVSFIMNETVAHDLEYGPGENIVVGSDFVSIDAANVPSLNRSANVSVAVSDCAQNWNIYYSPNTASSLTALKADPGAVQVGSGTGASGTCSVTLPGDASTYCSNPTCSGGILTYEVLHFSSTGAENQQGITINNIPGGITVTNTSGDTLSFPTSETTAQFRKAGVPIVEFTLDQSSDVDLTGVTLDTDAVSGESFIDGFSSSIDGISGTHSLFIPDLGEGNGPYVCASASDLSEVIWNCSGVVIYNPCVGDCSEVNIGGQDYFRIDSLTTSGGGNAGNASFSTQMTLSTTSIDKFNTFTVEINATCNNGSCNSITLQVDPIKSSFLPYSLIATLMLGLVIGGLYFRRGQTASEYVVLSAVVLVVALVAVALLGEFPGIGSSSDKKVSDYELTTGKVGIDNYACEEDSSKYLLRNNHFNRIAVNTVFIEDIECETSDLSTTLNIGQTKEISCSNINCSSLNEQTGIATVNSLAANILWTDTTTGLRFSEGGSPNLPAKGILTNSSTDIPFYIIGDDSFDCPALTIGESCVNTFTVNATGPTGSYAFFGIASNGSVTVNSPTESVSIT